AGNGGETGIFNVTIDTVVASSSRFSIIQTATAQATVNATGNCIITGQPTVSLSGTYTPSNGALSLTSGDGTTVFTGTIANGTASGTFTGPNGLSGGFSAQ